MIESAFEKLKRFYDTITPGSAGASGAVRQVGINRDPLCGKE